MSEEPTAAVSERITRLEKKVSSLRWLAFLIWPMVWGLSIWELGNVSGEGGCQFLRKAEESAFLGVMILIAGLIVHTVIRTIMDYRRRDSAFILNPGSRVRGERIPFRPAGR